MIHRLINSLFIFSLILSLLILTSLAFNKNHNFYFKKLNPSTWLSALDKIEFYSNHSEIIINSSLVAKKNDKYDKIYKYLMIKNNINLNY